MLSSIGFRVCLMCGSMFFLYVVFGFVFCGFLNVVLGVVSKRCVMCGVALCPMCVFFYFVVCVVLDVVLFVVCWFVWCVCLDFVLCVV